MSNTSFSQEQQLAAPEAIPKKVWFISTSIGVQMSGIKDEDFISKNIAPALTIGGGLWFTPEIALYFGYKGPYFNTIADDDKHYYNYFLGEVCFNMNEIINGVKKNQSKWSLLIHPGAGYFYNRYYERPNIVGHIGITNSLSVSNAVNIFIDLGVIVGWDIYQENDDILPSCTFGITYSFKHNNEFITE
jgi:hypothetical protein